MKTTFGEIYSYDPCASGWITLCTNKLGTELHEEKEISIMEILTSNGIKHAVWALRTQDYRDYCLFIADVAESVLHIFEKECPGDMRVRDLIAGIRRWHAGDIYDEELDVLRIAAYDAVSGSISVGAEAAARAAYSSTSQEKNEPTAEDIVESACNASICDAIVAYAAVAGYAFTAAEANAAAASARRKQWQKIEMLLRKHLGKGE